MLRFLLGAFIFMFPLINLIPQKFILSKGFTLLNLVIIFIIIISLYHKIYGGFKLPPTNKNIRLASFLILFFAFIAIYNNLFGMYQIFSNNNLIGILKTLELTVVIVIVLNYSRIRNIRLMYRRIMKITVIFIAITVIFDFIFPGILSNIYIITTKGSGLTYRSSGLFEGHPTQLGCFLIIGEALILSESKVAVSIRNWVFLLIIFIGIVFSGTRAAFVLSIVLLMYHQVRFMRHGFGIAIIFICIGYLTFVEIGDNIMYRFSFEYQSIDDMIETDRPNVWRRYILELYEQPAIIFWGALGGNIKYQISTHSVFLNIIIKVGIWGFLVFFIFSLQLLNYIRKKYQLRSGIFLAFISWYLLAILNENESLQIIFYLILFLSTEETHRNSKPSPNSKYNRLII